MNNKKLLILLLGLVILMISCSKPSIKAAIVSARNEASEIGIDIIDKEEMLLMRLWLLIWL